MKKILADIKKKEFERAYLFYGEEEYLKLQYKDRLISAVLGGEESMNFSRFEGENCDLGQIIDMAETLPFLGKYRCILVVDSGFFDHSNDQFASYLEEIPETTVLIFLEQKVKKSTKPYKAIVQFGYACDFEKPSEEELQRWISGRLSKENKRMSMEAWREFALRCSENMDSMSQELEKLINYMGERERIELEDVLAICTRPLQDQIFDMLNAMIAKDSKRLMNYYADLLAMKEPPLRVLNIMEKQLMQILAVRELAQEHLSSQQIGEKLKLRSYVVDRIRNRSRGMKKEEMERYLQIAADMEEDIKSGRITDRIGVELLMIYFSKAS